MKKKTITILCLAMACVFSVGCEVSGIVDLVNPDCYVEGAITADEYDNLFFWEKPFYDKNSCGLYIKQSAGDIIDHLF